MIKVGTLVTVMLDSGATLDTKTRSEPWQLGSGHWVVQLEGKPGCYLLDRVKERGRVVE